MASIATTASNLISWITVKYPPTTSGSLLTGDIPERDREVLFYQLQKLASRARAQGLDLQLKLWLGRGEELSDILTDLGDLILATFEKDTPKVSA